MARKKWHRSYRGCWLPNRSRSCMRTRMRGVVQLDDREIKTLTTLSNSIFLSSSLSLSLFLLYYPLVCKPASRLPAVREIDKSTAAISIAIATNVLSHGDARDRVDIAAVDPLFRHRGWSQSSASSKLETRIASTKPRRLFLLPSLLFTVS